jgi:ketosteroid isomerase-like protein
MANSEQLMEVMAPAMGGLEPLIDEATIDRMVKAMGPIATDDFTCGMIAMDVAQEFEGPEGLRGAWSDWLEAYTELHFRIHEVRDIGENVLMVVDQVGITRHGGVEVAQPSAAVWKFRDTRLYRVEFHLDRRAAERSAQSVQE